MTGFRGKKKNFGALIVTRPSALQLFHQFSNSPAKGGWNAIELCQDDIDKFNETECELFDFNHMQIGKTFSSLAKKYRQTPQPEGSSRR